MLFNSYEFIFAFLPITLLLFFGLGRLSRSAAIRWLILASLGFYAWWRPMNVLIIAPSIIINFLLSRLLLRLLPQKRPAASRAVLLLGITFNLAFLGYFKYVNFFAGAINDAFGTSLVLTQIILPLGISFITFQKIAFLIDVHGGRIASFTLEDYCLFVLFFPQLIAGPIVHYREMMPQFHAAGGRFRAEDFAVGLTLFVFGLFKKVVLADSIAPLVSTIFAQTQTGHAVTFLPAWMAALGFTLQIYFDFSGYSDMALGLARFVGVRFPANFNSPLKASSIIEFWLRWHVTLTRFLTAYIYNPLVLNLTRKRVAKGKAAIGGRRTTLGSFLELLAFPTLLTMFISGFWHGAGYTFVLWGLLHGVYLCLNHAWRIVLARWYPEREQKTRQWSMGGFMTTLLAVVFAMVLFRAATVSSAAVMLKGMVGANGIGLPSIIYDRLGPLAGVMERLGVHHGLGVELNFPLLAAWTVVLSAIAFLLPNTLQVLHRYEPALGWKVGQEVWDVKGREIAWRPSLGWFALVSIVAVIAVLHLGGQSEFLYWQF